MQLIEITTYQVARILGDYEMIKDTFVTTSREEAYKKAIMQCASFPTGNDNDERKSAFFSGLTEECRINTLKGWQYVLKVTDRKYALVAS